MFLLMPAMMRAGAPFWLTLSAGTSLKAILYLAMNSILARFGISL